MFTTEIDLELTLEIRLVYHQPAEPEIRASFSRNGDLISPGEPGCKEEIEFEIWKDGFHLSSLEKSLSDSEREAILAKLKEELSHCGIVPKGKR